MSKKIYLNMGALLLGSISLSAQQDSSLGKRLDEVVVTATKYPLKQSLTSKVLTIIDREQLEKSAGRTLGELLNTQAGVNVNGSQNTPGTNQDIYLQGAAAGKTLILIDGIPAYDPSGTSTAFDLNLINIDQVERIEILKGSQSTLYGSDAIAGVINIITKKGSGKPFSPSIRLSGGSYGTYQVALGLNGQLNRTTYNIQYTKLKSDGISAAYDSTINRHFDNDGFDENSVLVNLGQKISKIIKLRANFQYNQYNAELDAGAFQEAAHFTSTSKNYIAGIGAEFRVGEALLHLNYNYNSIKRTYLDDSVAGMNPNFSYGSYNGWSHYLELYSNISLTKHLDLLVGGDYREQRTGQHYLSISSFGPYQSDLGKDSAQTTQMAAYLSLVLKGLAGYNLEAGVRYNHFSQFGEVVTYSLNPSYGIGQAIKIFANLSSGFQTPTLYELYSQFRNPFGSLKPEKSVSFEGGTQLSQKHFNGRALFFNRQITDNIIFYTGPPPNYPSYYANQDKQKDHGVELEASWQWNKWRLSGNYTYLTGEIHTRASGKDTTYNNLYRRPKNSFNLNAGMQATRKIFFSLSLRSIGERTEYVYGGAPMSLAPYYSIDSYLEYKWGKAVKIFADLKNITNQQYFDVPGYNSKRFNLMAGASVLF